MPRRQIERIIKDMKRRLKGKTTTAVCLLALSCAVSSCSGGSSDSDTSTPDGKTYSFIVSYFDDADEQVGYDYVPYGKPSRSVRKLDGKSSYDYKPHANIEAKAGIRKVFDVWEGKYENVDDTLPPYGEKHPAPTNGESVSINNIKGECSLKAVFKDETISYTTRFYSEGSIIKTEDGSSPYDDGVKHSWGDFVLPPSTPYKESPYGYKSDFLGYGFKSDGKSSEPFFDFSDAGFYYGYGEPTAVSQYFSDGGIGVSSVSPGSFYEDISTKDESGYYTFDLYGYDGEWTKLASMATLNPKINLYANFANPSKIDFDVGIYSSYDNYKAGGDPLEKTSATFASQISFSDDLLTLTFKQDQESKDDVATVDKSKTGFKNIRKWMGVFSDELTVSDLYRGKSMPDEAYVFAPLSLFPISSDCSLVIEDASGKEVKKLDAKYGSKITIDEASKTIEATDSEGTSASYSYSSLGDVDWELTYSTSDIALLDQFKGKSVSIEDAILGDCYLRPVE